MKTLKFLSIGLTSTILFSSVTLAQSEPQILKTQARLAAFSADSKHYIYLESYQQPITEIPKAYLQIFQVDKNVCVPKGCVSTDLGDDFAGKNLKVAEDNLLNQTEELRDELDLSRYLKTGISLPIISAKNIDKKGLDRVIVKLNEKGDNLILFLQQRQIKSIVQNGRSDISRSSMRLIAFFNYRRLTLGSLYDFKEGVSKFNIREVYLSPDRQKIVVLLNMMRPTAEGEVQTTLVQSFPLVNENKKPTEKLK